MYAFAIAAILATSPIDPCAYDRDRLLALEPSAFDQDLGGGWRKLADDPRCLLAAADLIRDYRNAHAHSSTILFWHEGQLRAEAGQIETAIALFAKARAT